MIAVQFKILPTEEFHMDRIISYFITKTDENNIILDFLRKNGFSRHILNSMKTDKRAILLNGYPAGGKTPLKSGDRLQIRIPETASGESILPVDMPLTVLYEDQDILILSKPSGMPVHPSLGNYENTLANGVISYLRKKGENCPFRCINRLDRDTSGGLIVAKNPLSASILSLEMKNRKIRRTYLAIVKGITPLRGTISAPIGRVSSSLMERHVDFDNGDPAVTHYERLAVKNQHSLLEIRLETGRTHQIRVHMGYLGYPLPADYLYCPDYSRFSRQPLHSFQLDFSHPLSGRPMCITASVPEDISLHF